MMVLSRVLLPGLALFAAGIAACGGALAQRGPAPGDLKAMQQRAMVFFMAKGAPNACGEGCSEWIAAEGMFDPEAHNRLNAFLNANNRPNLPVLFYSPGGMAGPALLVGSILRERRMTAGVGQTIPEGCRESPYHDQACRKRLASGGVFTAKLVQAGAICASGCVYALTGATTRQIAAGARLGIHASSFRRDGEGKAGAESREVSAASRARLLSTYDHLRKYVTLMGIDPGLIDEAEKTPHQRVHWMSREELARFGVVAGDNFETRWRAVEAPIFSIVKAVSRASPRTTAIDITCYSPGNAYVSVRRELAAEEFGSMTVVRMVSDGQTLWISPPRTSRATTSGRAWCRSRDCGRRRRPGSRSRKPSARRRAMSPAR